MPLRRLISLDPPDQFIPQRRNTRRKGLIILGRPIRAPRTRNGILALERKIQHIVAVVANISPRGLSIAGRGEGDGGFTNHGLGVVVAVFVAPYAVYLCGSV